MEEIQKAIEQIRIDNLKGLTQYQVDDRLYNLEILLFRQMDKTSDSKINSEFEVESNELYPWINQIDRDNHFKRIGDKWMRYTLNIKEL